MSRNTQHGGAKEQSHHIRASNSRVTSLSSNPPSGATQSTLHTPSPALTSWLWPGEFRHAQPSSETQLPPTLPDPPACHPIPGGNDPSRAQAGGD